MPSVPLTSIAGSGVRAWVSGATYAVGERAISLVNFQEYVRRVAGAGTTDPSADFTNWRRIYGFAATKELGIASNQAGFILAPVDVSVPDGKNEGILYQSGALTANTLATMFSFSGPIRVTQLVMLVTDATSRTIRPRIVVDGEPIFDRTSGANATANYGVCFAGVYDFNSTASKIVLPPIEATESLTIQWASSLTETAKFNGYIIYQELQ